MVSIQNLRAVRLRRKDRGATTADCRLAAALIAAVVATAVTSIGTNLTTLFNNVANAI
jgi:pilus assembly protein Flp/PilA